MITNIEREINIYLYMYAEQHGGAVVGTDASQEEKNLFKSDCPPEL